MKKNELSNYIDHTNLKPDATKEDIKNLCDEAIKYGFKAICINPIFVEIASEILKDQEIKIVAVVGFPLGAMQPSSKAFEAKEAINSGADEIDMVMNIGALKHKDYSLVYTDILSVVEEAGTCPVKVIIETCYLTRDEIIIASVLCSVAGAKYIKTSTGFNGSGAKIEDIKLIKSIIPENIKIKASGGIKTAKEAMEMIQAGASRIGASASVDIVTK